MKTKTKGLIALIVVIVAAIYYYVTIPAINIHSTLCGEQHLSFCHYLWCYIMAVQEATEALPFLILPQWLIPFTTKRSGILSGLR